MSVSFVDGLHAGVVRERGVVFTVALGQFGEMRVDFVLQQRRARGRAAPGHVAVFDDAGVVAVGGEDACDQRAGDARADDRDVAAHVALQRGEGRHEAVLHGPVGIARFEIHRPSLRARP